MLEQRLDGTESEWIGNFNDVDVSTISSMSSANPDDGRCKPVVYYSKKSREAFLAAGEAALDLKNTEFWTTERPANAEVTAIAVDCRKTNLNKDFVLAPQKQIDVTIDLTSPAAAPRNDMMTYNESYIKGTPIETQVAFTDVVNTTVMLHFTDPEFKKTSFPESGTSDDPETVVKNSVLDYIITITNPDDTVPIKDVLVEDTLQKGLSVNNTVKVGLTEGESVDISQTQRISSYSLATVGERVKFAATVKSLAPGETITITIPATVNLSEGTIVNTAYIAGYNGITFEPENYIPSDTTYHEVANIKAKIIKKNVKGDALPGAKLQILNGDKTEVVVDDITSTQSVLAYDVAPGNYVLHEVAAPSEEYKLAADIPFSIDIEGIIHVDGKSVSYVEMVDQPAYKIVFHENKYDGSNADKQKVFRIFEPTDLDDGKIKHFYDIPEWAGDEYVFAGWYHNSTFSYIEGITNTDATAPTPSVFESDTFTKPSTNSDGDYHLYAKWIKVGTVKKADEDTNIISGYRGFGLSGVQIREPQMHDSNYEEITPGGLRFVTSLSENLLSRIDALSTNKVATDEGDVDVEYGYAVGSEQNIQAFTDHYGIKDLSKYALQYKGENVNGVNTKGVERTADTDYRYISNVNCTKGTGKIKEDHRNFRDYRLYTLVVTYEGASESRKNSKVDARSYIRYYDANGKLRVFYNTYKKSMCSGCMCSYNLAKELALPRISN